MSKVIAEEWPVEYAGPRDVLGNGYIPWAGRPRLLENDAGEWLWLCTPNFLNDDALTDIQRLREHGWAVNIGVATNWLRVRITEKEAT
ncbi:hypothetical protein RN51_03325 [Microbacterium oxydans]|uniref:Uncharacterized protein n=1 Tax=Microbacterium oxydans TaxID=82380 RepID=A0A0F0KGT4_9MICO|nr:hypothetical protein [Microbacterium oxydans]KJL18491.1 hypothetical protein RN51_03325 [Microbacterium oxydans]